VREARMMVMMMRVAGNG
jgi:hypothetical protein